jgi:hypothetical protein
LSRSQFLANGSAISGRRQTETNLVVSCLFAEVWYAARDVLGRRWGRKEGRGACQAHTVATSRKTKRTTENTFFEVSVPLDDIQEVFRMASSAQKRRHGR